MLSERDRKRLTRVDSRLVRVVTRAALDNPGLFFVDKNAARDVATERILIAGGHSRLKDPYHSKHVVGPQRPLSHAVDLYPMGYADLTQVPHEAYAHVAAAIKMAAAAECVPVEWGWEIWNGFDAPHHQLADDT
jgi:hypothetical protein